MSTNSNENSKIRISLTNKGEANQSSKKTAEKHSPFFNQNNKIDYSFKSPLEQLEKSNRKETKIKNNEEKHYSINSLLESSINKKENNPSERPKKKTTTGNRRNESNFNYLSEGKIGKNNLIKNANTINNNSNNLNQSALNNANANADNSQINGFFPFLYELSDKEKSEFYFASDKNYKKINLNSTTNEKRDLNLNIPAFDFQSINPNSSKSRSKPKSKKKASEINQRISKKFNSEDFTEIEKHTYNFDENPNSDFYNNNNNVITVQNSKEIKVPELKENMFNVHSDSYLNTISNIEKSIVKAKKKNNYFSEAEKENILSSIKQRKSILALKIEVTGALGIQENSLEAVSNKENEKLIIENENNNKIYFDYNNDSFGENKLPIKENFFSNANNNNVVVLLTEEELIYQKYFIFKKELINKLFLTRQMTKIHSITEEEADLVHEEILKLWFHFIKFYKYEKNFTVDYLNEKYAESFKDQKTQEEILTYIIESELFIPQFPNEFDFYIEYPIAEKLNELFLKFKIYRTENFKLISNNLEGDIILTNAKTWIIYMKILKEIFNFSFKELVEVFNFALTIKEIDEHILFDFFMVLLTEYPNEEINEIHLLENFPKKFVELYQDNKELIQKTLEKEAEIFNSSENSHESDVNKNCEKMHGNLNAEKSGNDYMDIVDDNVFNDSKNNKNANEIEEEEKSFKLENEILINGNSVKDIIVENKNKSFNSTKAKLQKDNSLNAEKAELNFTLDEEEFVEIHDSFPAEKNFKLKKTTNSIEEIKFNLDPIDLSFNKAYLKQTPKNNLAENRNEFSNQQAQSESYGKIQNQTRKAFDDLIDLNANYRVNNQAYMNLQVDNNANNINNIIDEKLTEEKENINLIDFSLETPIKNTKTQNNQNDQAPQNNKKSSALQDEKLSELKKIVEDSENQMSAYGFQRVEKFFDKEEDLQDYLYQVLNKTPEEKSENIYEEDQEQSVKATKKTIYVLDRTPSYEYSIIPEESNESKFTASKANESFKRDVSLGKLKLTMFETQKKSANKNNTKIKNINSKDNNNNYIVNNTDNLIALCENIFETVSKKKNGKNSDSELKLNNNIFEDKISKLDLYTVNVMKEIFKEEIQGLGSKLGVNSKSNTESKLNISAKKTNQNEAIEKSALNKKLQELADLKNKANCDPKDLINTNAPSSSILNINNNSKSPFNKEARNASNNKANKNIHASNEKKLTANKKKKNQNNISYSSDSNASSYNNIQYPLSDLDAKNNNKSMKKSKKKILTPVREWIKKKQPWETEIDPVEIDNFCFEIHPYQRPNANAYVIDFNYQKSGIWAIILVPLIDEEIKKWKQEYLYGLVQLNEFTRENSGLAIRQLNEIIPYLGDDGYGNIKKPDLCKALKQLEERISNCKMDVSERV